MVLVFQNRKMMRNHLKASARAAAFQSAWLESCDARVVNEALHKLGTEVRLRWQTVTVNVRKW